MLQRSLLLRVFKLLFLVWVMCLLLILKSAPYLPLHSDPSILGIISSAYNLGKTLSFYIFGGELVSALENLLSKRTFKGHSQKMQFFHDLNKYFFYSVYGYYAKLVCCFYLIIAFFVFIYLLN